MPHPPILCRACCVRTADENPEGADDELRLELLKVGPFCLGDEGQVLFCSSTAKRTQRSGIFELQYLARDDREYWSKLLPNTPESPHSKHASRH